MLQGVRWVGMGRFHTVAVTESGVASFGSNSHGQLGLGHSSSSAPQPVAVVQFAAGQVASVACGEEHTLFLCRCPPVCLLVVQCCSLCRGARPALEQGRNSPAIGWTPPDGPDNLLSRRSCQVSRWMGSTGAPDVSSTFPVPQLTLVNNHAGMGKFMGAEATAAGSSLASRELGRGGAQVPHVQLSQQQSGLAVQRWCLPPCCWRCHLQLDATAAR